MHRETFERLQTEEKEASDDVVVALAAKLERSFWGTVIVDLHAECLIRRLPGSSSWIMQGHCGTIMTRFLDR